MVGLLHQQALRPSILVWPRPRATPLYLDDIKAGTSLPIGYQAYPANPLFTGPCVPVNIYIYMYICPCSCLHMRSSLYHTYVYGYMHARTHLRVGTHAPTSAPPFMPMLKARPYLYPRLSAYRSYSHPFPCPLSHTLCLYL